MQASSKNSETGPLLVTGGSGNLGRRVIELLLASARVPIIATTRTPERLADLKERGVDVRQADHSDPASLAKAYEGADRMLIISSFGIGARAAQIRNVAAAAEKAGVRHACYTSAASPRPDPSDIVTDDHFWSELALFQSRLSWTVLRHNMYAEHIFLTLPIGVATGELLSPIGSMGRGYVTREDCARADAAALMTADYENKTLDVSGPSFVTHSDLADWAREATGRPVAYRAAGADEAAESWIKGGLREIVARSLAVFDQVAGEGRHAIVSKTVEDLAGAPPEHMRDFIKRNAACLMPDENGKAVIEEDLVVAPPAETGA